jgi:8-oxo-dGTP diphosphatase
MIEQALEAFLKPVKHYCLGFIFHGDRVVLISKKRPEWQVGKLNGIGGKVEPGETSVAAMSRECKEETNVFIPESAWTYFATLQGDGYIIDVFFTHEGTLTSLKTTTDEEISVEWIDELNRIPVIPNLRWLIPMAESFRRGEKARRFEIKEIN